MMLVPVIAERDAFKPYGDVIGPGHGAPKTFLPEAFGRCAPGLRYALSVNSLPACKAPVIAVSSMERHPHSSQIFIPLTPGNYLSIVGLRDPNDAIDLTSVRAFLIPCARGIVYRPGTWHFAFTAVGAPGDVAVIMGLSDQESDTEFVDLPDPIRVDLSGYGGNA